MPDAITRLNAALEGRYRIESELGEGGMATVYLADDLKHERKVALKVLKPELAAVVGAERFLAEIKTTANLTHPNILPLHDSGEAEGFLFYVMPFVEGETLRDRLEREHQLPVDDAVRIASDVAEALDYAHDHGVIHRDIKPANILIQAGRPLIADFGIALAVNAGGGGRLTETGLSLGTPHYMSPEQATGDQGVGPATDIYAVGCVLYEMLVGEPPFTGSTPQAILGKIIVGSHTPPSGTRTSVPHHIDAVISQALEGVPADRFPSGDAFARALSDRSFRTSSGGAGARIADGRPALSAAIGLLLMGAVAGAAVSWALAASRVETEGPSWHHIAPLGEGNAKAVRSQVALAPDGSGMVYPYSDDGMRTWLLVLKSRSSLEIRELPGTEQADNVTYSPDGEWIAFLVPDPGEVLATDRQILKTYNLRDGRSLEIARGVEKDGERPILVWQDDGTIVYEPAQSANPIVRVAEDGSGTADTVAVLNTGEISAGSALPGSQGILLADSRGVGVLEFGVDTLRMLFPGATAAWYATSGHVVYVGAGSSVFAVPFDLKTLTVSGSGSPVLNGVSQLGRYVGMTLGQDGTLLYVEGPTSEGGYRDRLVWVDRDGSYEPVSDVLTPAPYHPGAISPDGTKIAVPIGRPDGEGSDIWIFSLPDGPLQRLTTGPGGKRRPDWLPNGRDIAYITGRSPRTVPADASAESSPLEGLPDDVTIHEVFHAQFGTGVLFRYGDAQTGDGTIGYVDGGASAARLPLFESEFNERSVSLSPDAKWLSYQSNSTGSGEVYVRALPQALSPLRVSLAGGRDPVWGEESNELFYIDPDGYLHVAHYSTEDGFVVNKRERLFQLTQYYRETNGGAWRRYDIGPDGRFLLVRRQDAVEAELRFILVENFHEELKRLVPN